MGSEVKHRCFRALEDNGLLDTIDNYTKGPYARVKWVDYQNRSGGWLMTNKERGPQGVFVPNDVVIEMASKPRAYAMFEGMQVIDKGTAEAICTGATGDMTPETKNLHDNAMNRI